MSSHTLPLKDLQLPEPSHFWPPALGWWVLAVALIILVFLAFRWWQRNQRLACLALAKKQLQAIKRIHKEQPIESIQAVSILLKRVAITVSPTQHVAGLIGLAWLVYLDKSLTGKPFSEGVGKCLVVAPYCETPDVSQLTELINLTERWLSAQAAHLLKHNRPVKKDND
jgi:hypothetical protein